MARIVKTTSLYTLIVKPDQSFVIKIDGDQVKEGNLLEDFAPAVNPEKEIDDPKDEKPADWVDEAKIPTQKPLNLKIGMKTLHMKLLMMKLRNLTIGSRMNLPRFLIPRLRSQKTGMMKRMEIGLLQLYQILNVRTSLGAANGNSLPKRTLIIKENGHQNLSITPLTRVCGVPERLPTQTTMRIRLQPTLNQWEP